MTESSHGASLHWWVDSATRSYSQILFSRSRLVGLVLMLGLAAWPVGLAAGLASVALGIGVAVLLDFERETLRAGLYTYNALLVGLGCAALMPLSKPWSLLLFATAVCASVFVTAAARSFFSRAELPVLTLPFLAVFYLVPAVGPALGIELHPLSYDASSLSWLPLPIAALFRALAALFFSPSLWTGILVFAALLLHSRIATLLAGLAFVMAYQLSMKGLTVPDPASALVLGYNFLLIAIAVGGVWFVPSWSSLLLALVGALMCGLLSLGLAPRLFALGVPLLILPFNLIALGILLAMRQRTRDAAPKAVDFVPGTPEENLAYFRTRVSRFGRNYAVRVHAPFRGLWTCTQGVEGIITHQKQWAHALDFEVVGKDGEPYRNTGKALKDYHCYRLPILACADGTVTTVVDGVRDNRPGEINTAQNWGNHVILYHGPGLYSLVAHLSPGSISVKPGQAVRQGEQLGLCGSSGRSPQPHLHFQLQGGPKLGCATIHFELHDVVEPGTESSSSDERECVRSVWTPAEGDRLRNIELDEELLTRLSFQAGQRLRLRSQRGEREPDDESVVVAVDLLGNRTLASERFDTTLYMDSSGAVFTVYDCIGPRRSGLHLIHWALPRVPLDQAATIRWGDHLPGARFLPQWMSPAFDLLAPFAGDGGLEMHYESRRKGQELIVTGSSSRHWRDAPLLRTEATVGPKGHIDIHIRLRDRELHAELAPERADNPTPQENKTGDKT